MKIDPIKMDRVPLREMRAQVLSYAVIDIVKHYLSDDLLRKLSHGLERAWAPHRVFMNPPYGREVYAWTRKARLEAAVGALVVGLLPCSSDLAWWHDDVVGHAEVRYIRGRVRFLTDGPYRASGFFASVIVIWRPHATT